MSLSVDSIVDVDILVSPGAPQARGFGTLLVLGLSTVLPTEERIKTYVDADGLLDDGFSTNSEEWKAANVYFSQSPAPKQIKIGRRLSAATAGHLRGGTASQTIADYTGVSSGGFDININGTNRQITGIDLSAQSTMAGIATQIQTRLVALLAGVTCVFTGGHFLITSPTTGTSSTVGYGAAPTGSGPPVDISSLLKLKQADGALSVAGLAIENMTQSLAASSIFDADWYGSSLTADASTQDIKDAAAWTEAQKRVFGYTTSDANAKLASATSDLGYFFHNLGYSRTFGQFSTSYPYAHVSAIARAFVVDFDQPNSTITLKFKQEPQIGVETLTETERLALEGKNLNYYASFGDFAMLAQGVVASGRFFDEIHGLDWLQSTIQNFVFGKIATAVTKIPLTDKGAAKLVQAAQLALEKAVNNGFLAPGNWSGDDVGQVKSGDFLPNGYYVFASPVSSMSDADRTARKAPPITAIGIGAGAIHSVNMTFTFQR